MTTTRYFTEQILRKRPYLTIALCRSVLVNPIRRTVQDDGRIRHWGRIILPNETETRILRVVTLEEGRFLCAILNSETARAAAEHWQSEGQWGKRDFDKAVFNLPIPLFDAADPVHTALAKAAAKAEKMAAKVELKAGEHFPRTRKGRGGGGRHRVERG